MVYYIILLYPLLSSRWQDFHGFHRQNPFFGQFMLHDDRCVRKRRRQKHVTHLITWKIQEPMEVPRILFQGPAKIPSEFSGKLQSSRRYDCSRLNTRYSKKLGTRRVLIITSIDGLTFHTVASSLNRMFTLQQTNNSYGKSPSFIVVHRSTRSPNWMGQVSSGYPATFEDTNECFFSHPKWSPSGEHTKQLWHYGKPWLFFWG